jgi:hypothetical protein
MVAQAPTDFIYTKREVFAKFMAASLRLRYTPDQPRSIFTGASSTAWAILSQITVSPKTLS